MLKPLTITARIVSEAVFGIMLFALILVFLFGTVAHMEIEEGKRVICSDRQPIIINYR